MVFLGGGYYSGLFEGMLYWLKLLSQIGRRKNNEDLDSKNSGRS